MRVKGMSAIELTTSGGSKLYKLEYITAVLLRLQSYQESIILLINNASQVKYNDNVKHEHDLEADTHALNHFSIFHSPTDCIIIEFFLCRNLKQN